MIYIANDVGSAELSPEFNTKTECRVIELKSADFCFTGNGPDGLCGIGIERKTLGDLISSMHSGRLMAHQLPQLIEHYEYPYLLVESGYRCNPDNGLIEEYVRGGWAPPRGGGYKGLTYETVDHFLTTITTRTPVRLLRTSSVKQTVAAVISLYNYFQTPWESHGSWKTFHSPPPPVVMMERPQENRSSDEDWQRWVCRLVTKELPGIGWVRSGDVADKFGTVRRAIMASPDDWLEIDGIGPATVKRVDRALGKRNE